MAEFSSTTAFPDCWCSCKANDHLAQLCLDVENDLHGPYPENADG